MHFAFFVLLGNDQTLWEVLKKGRRQEEWGAQEQELKESEALAKYEIAQEPSNISSELQV